MAFKIDLERHRTASNSDSFAKLSGAVHDNIRADLKLEVRLNEYRQLQFLLLGEAGNGMEVDEGGISKRSAMDVFRIADNCRREWVKGVVDLRRLVAGAVAGVRNELPFQDFWSFRQNPQLLQEIAPELAKAGSTLFSLIFEREGDEDLKQLGRRLRAVMATGPALPCSDLGRAVPSLGNDIHASDRGRRS
jgi:hypothetical protein